MLRSLFTGISGLTAHQQMLDVTANNIANVNTTGFKGSSTVFQDTLSQTIAGAAASNGTIAGANDATIGGTNSKQIGLGVRLGGTELNMTQGSAQSTGVGTDLMINGDGFFVVSKGDAANKMYTRAGSFHIDNIGNLVTPDGAIVMGYDMTDADTVNTNAGGTPPYDPSHLDLSALIDPDSAANPYAADGTYNPAAATKMSYVSYSIGQGGKVNAVGIDGNTYTLGQISIATFANPNGLAKSGDTQFTSTPSSGNPTLDPGSPHGTISAGYLEMSNADLAKQLTDLIISERGFQANSKVVTTSDEVLQTLVNLKR